MKTPARYDDLALEPVRLKLRELALWRSLAAYDDAPARTAEERAAALRALLATPGAFRRR